MFFTVNLSQDQSELSPYISNTLLESIEETINKGEKCLLYLNKRGAYSSLICEDCQHLFECPNCDVSLSVHSNPEHLKCHICQHNFRVPLTCPSCGGNKLKNIGVGTQQVEEKLKSYFEEAYKNNEFSGSKPSHLNSLSQNTSLNLSCEERNSFNNNVVGNYYETPDYVKNLAKSLRGKQTNAEKILWEILRAKRFYKLKFRRQHPFGRYIADFYCDEKNLAIELDGKIHENQKEYDEIRDDVIQQYGVQILRIKNEEILNNISKALEKIVARSLSWQERVGERCCEEKNGDEECLEGKRENIGKPPNIYRFDSDSMKNISSKKLALTQLESADIIIGTKMITTGFDFEKIGLIGVLLVEGELSHPSYDAHEQAYSNLRQIIGRGNRKSQETKIILQTFIPKNPLIKALCESNYKDFLVLGLSERKDFGYPPYSEMVSLEYRHKDSTTSLEYIQKLLRELEELPEATELQFLPASSSFRKNNMYHSKLIIKGENLRNTLRSIESKILANPHLSIIFHE